INIPSDCAAYRLLFEPEKLEGFDLVYENEMYRLFRVGEGSSRRNWPRSPLFYERELLWRFEGDIGAFYGNVMRIYALTSRGRFLLEKGMEREAENKLTEALRVFYFYPAWRALDGLYERQGRLKEREVLSQFAYYFDPNRGDVCIGLAAVRLDLGKIEGVRELLERCASLQLSGRQRMEVGHLMRRLESMSRRGAL
ncbi:MAG: hypothetical protein KAX38_02330, partial [Candidatus Krumholzibacteria bacterium]|nr:hypothetical protein [Candidatus Krumholzibacteria bacterium]